MRFFFLVVKLFQLVTEQWKRLARQPVNLDTEILGVSVDSQFSHLKWIQTPKNQGGLGQLDYPLVSDLTKEISYKYGVLMDDSISTRGLFIIDAEGVIQHVTINNLPVGRNVDETLRLISAFKHVQAK